MMMMIVEPGISHFELFAEQECKEDKWNAEMKYKNDNNFWSEIHCRRIYQGYNLKKKVEFLIPHEQDK